MPVSGRDERFVSLNLTSNLSLDNPQNGYSTSRATGNDSRSVIVQFQIAPCAYSFVLADSIQEDPLPFQRQRTLAALARANKTFYSICNHRLYLDPILHQTNKKKWIRFYCLQVNPFTLAKNSTGFESIVIPRSVSPL
jgi:hypothetical protein